MFSKGNGFTVYPLKVLFAFTGQQESLLQAAVSVSSRSFKKAVQRNRVKRLMREAYRLQKGVLQQHLEVRETNLVLFFIYIGKTLPLFSEIQPPMNVILHKVSELVLANAKKD